MCKAKARTQGFGVGEVPGCQFNLMNGRHGTIRFLQRTALCWFCAVAQHSDLDAQTYASEADAPTSARWSELAIAQRHRTHTKPLDLSRSPTTEELIAAGQLGGPLFPTHALKDRKRQDAAHLDFGKAIEDWNKHEYPKAVGMLRKHVRDFPDSPWAAEAELHIGCDATYNGRYNEAEAIFQKLIFEHQGKPDPGAKMMLSKARQRLGLLKIEQHDLAQAGAIFRSQVQESPDWRQRTYASHWIQRLSGFVAAKQALLTCGVDALAYAITKAEPLAGEAELAHRARAADQIRTNLPATMRGHSLASLVELAANQGFELAAVHVGSDDISRLPLPAILHIMPAGSVGTGHFWVLDRVIGQYAELFDPQSKRRFSQTTDELRQEWGGSVLLFARGAPLPGRRMTPAELEALTGGCCGVPRQEEDLGEPDQNPEDPKKDDPCSKGSPRWSVNVVNLNLFVTDTPLWYDPPFGPPVQVTLSYNSQASISYHEPFGNKWQFNYASYLVVDTSGTVLIFMPDGRRDVFSPNGSGGFVSPYQVFNTLNRIATNHFELRFPDDSVYVYRIPVGTSSQQPFLTEIRDAYGQHLTFGYDANIRLVNITDPQGKAFILTYNAVGLVTNVADPFGRNATFAYDANRNLVKITDMGGYWSGFSYDNTVYLKTVSNERGTWSFWIEPADGQPANADNYPPPGDTMWENYRVTITNPLGFTEEYFFYAGCDEFSCGGQTWHVAPRYYVPWASQQENTFRLDVPKTRYLFTSTSSGQRGEIKQVVTPSGSLTGYGYDAVTGNRTSTVDAHGHTNRFTHNGLGRLTSATGVNGRTTLSTYSPNNVDILAISNGLGIIRMTYNAQHDVKSLADQITNTTTYGYNSFGQTTTQVDALGITNQFFYDTNQRLAELRRADETINRFTYDSIGRVQTSTDATGLTITNDYNNLNQVVRVTYPDGRSERYTYSTCCPRLKESVTDRGGRTTLFVHDALKRLVQSISPEGGITQFSWDANGNLIQLLDPNRNSTTYTYDSDNRLVHKIHADGKGVAFAYDLVGLVIARTNARSIVTSYTYDANHNLTAKWHSDSTPGVTNLYDAFNRLTEFYDAAGRTIVTYDANSRISSVDGPWTNDTITYSYDSLGQRTNQTLQGSQSVSYKYDLLNRLTSLRVGAGAYIYSYQGASALVRRLDRPNGSYTTYAYDTLNRLSGIANRRSTGVLINEFLYSYNTQDLRSSETITDELPWASSTNEFVKYEPNALNQAMKATPPGKAFVYDADGNMTTGPAPIGGTFTALYDAENRPRSIAVTNGALVAQVTYTYGANSLVATTLRQVPGQPATEVRNLRDGYFPMQERDGTNSIVRQYAWGLNMGGGIGGLLGLEQGGSRYGYIYDGKGNVVGVLDETQSRAGRYSYDSFGVLLSKSELMQQPYGYSTKPSSGGLGFVDFGYRMYIPNLGRWLVRDPAGEAVGVNLYAFNKNSPLNLVDPLGLESEDGVSPGKLVSAAEAAARLALGQGAKKAAGAFAPGLTDLLDPSDLDKSEAAFFEKLYAVENQKWANEMRRQKALRDLQELTKHLTDEQKKLLEELKKGRKKQMCE